MCPLGNMRLNAGQHPASCRRQEAGGRRQVLEPTTAEPRQQCRTVESPLSSKRRVPALILRSGIRTADASTLCECGIGFGLCHGDGKRHAKRLWGRRDGRIVKPWRGNHERLLHAGQPDKLCKVNFALCPRGSDRCAYSLCCGPLLADG